MNRIRELRKEKRMTQAQLGDMVHASQQTISKIEGSARNDFSCDLLTALADYFEVSTDYILRRNDERRIVFPVESDEQAALLAFYKRLHTYDRKILLHMLEDLASHPQEP